MLRKVQGLVGGVDAEHGSSSGSDSDDQHDASSLSHSSANSSSHHNKRKHQHSQERLRKGDYVIHVHIIEARDLKGRGHGDSSDPIVEVEILGKKQTTQIHKSTFNCTFNETKYFEFRDAHPQQIEQAVVRMSVYDANSIRRNVLIGAYHVDAASVYYRPRHELYRQWCALTDVTDKHEGIQGFLKFTIVVLGPHDEQYVHPRGDEDDEDDAMMSVLMPPKISQTGRLLRIQVHEFQHLPVMDKLAGVLKGRPGRRCQPYVKVKFAGSVCKTDSFRGTDVIVNRELHVPVMEPLMTDMVRCQVYDRDVGKNDLIGAFAFPYEALKTSTYGMAPRWFHMYGSPVKFRSTHATLMNEGLWQGSLYKGSVLVSANVRAEDMPRMSCEEMPERPVEDGVLIDIDAQRSGFGGMFSRSKQSVPTPASSSSSSSLLSKAKDALHADEDQVALQQVPFALTATEKPPQQQWTLQVDLYEGSEIPDLGDGTIRVEVCCGAYHMSSHSAVIKQGRCTWYDVVRDKKGLDLELTMPADTSQCPDVFVYLSLKKRRISFKRFAFASLLASGWTCAPEWHVLIECAALNALSERDFPGSLLLGMRLGLTQDVPAEVSQEARPFTLHGVDSHPLEEEDNVAVAAMLQASRDLKQTALEAGVEVDVDDLTTKVATPAPPPPPVAISASGSTESTVGHITIHVIECKDLPIHDRTSSDPYVKLKVISPAFADQKFETKCVKKSLNPTYDETFTIRNVPMHCTLKFKVMDKDMVKDELMGALELDIPSLQHAANGSTGTDWQLEQWFAIPDTETNAMIRLGFTFEYIAVADAQAVEATVAKKEEKASHSVTTIMKKVTKQTASTVTGGLIGGLSNSATLLSNVKRTAPKGVLGYPLFKQYQLRVHLFQGRSLLSTDNNGLADPYVVVRCCGHGCRFPVVNETLNPQWFQSKTMIVALPEPLCLAPAVQVFVFDHDQMGKDDPMGRFCVSAEEAAAINAPPTGGGRDRSTSVRGRDNQAINPVWFDLRTFDDRESPECGKLLMSFELLSLAEVESRPPFDMYGIRPPTVEKHLHVVVLGLRGMQSALGVHKPFVDFELPNGRRFSTTPSCTPSRASPNYLEVVKIPVQVPLDPVFASVLDIEVRDSLFGGTVKRLIGNTTIPMAQFIADVAQQKQKRKLELSWQSDLQKEEDQWAEHAAAQAKLREKELNAAIEAEKQKVRDRDARLAAEKKRRRLAQEAKGDVSVDVDDSDGNLLADDHVASDDVELTPARGAGKEKKASNGDDGRGLGMNFDDAEDDAHAEHDITGGAKLKKGEFDTPDAVLYNADDPAVLARAALDTADEDVPEYLRGRHTVDNELEDEMPLSPFSSYTLTIGQKSTSVLAKKFAEVGVLKGIISLHDSPDAELDVDTVELLSPKQLVCRLYVLTGIRLMPHDSNGLSDPYLVVKCGNQKFSTRANYHKNTVDPEFYESFEFPVMIPGDAHVEISVMDWDGVGDDFMGSTTIDIEDRWFSKCWRQARLKPLERRTLRNPTASSPQGKLEMWLELMTPEQAKMIPMTNIKPPPPAPYELRCIVWKTRDVTIKDTVTNQNDLFVTGHVSIPGMKKQSTDTHLRSKKGKGNFNWRMKFPIMLPPPNKVWPRIRFQIWDKDFFSATDSICEVVMGLKGLCKEAVKKQDRVQILMKGKDKFWVDNLRHPNQEGTQGRMQISLELVPQALATLEPAGFGRSDPNTNPFLPEPEGRINLSLMHPLQMLKDLLGPELYRKMWCWFCLAFVVFLLVMIAPMVWSNWIADALNPFN